MFVVFKVLRINLLKFAEHLNGHWWLACSKKYLIMKPRLGIVGQESA
jgi:hypothetical protein